MTTETTPTPASVEATERLLQILDAQVPDDLKAAYPALRRRIAMSVQKFARLSDNNIETMPGDVGDLALACEHAMQRIDLFEGLLKNVAGAAQTDEAWAYLRDGILSTPVDAMTGVPTH